MTTPVLLLFCVVAMASFYAITNWRAGVFLWLMIAILQDPIRKITPGTPVYLTVSFAPIYLATFLGMLQAGKSLREMPAKYRDLNLSYRALMLCVFCSLVLVLLGGKQSYLRSLLGAMTYVGGVPAVLVGYFLLKDRPQILDHLFIAFAIMTSLMLIGVPLENSGYRFEMPLLGTIAMKGPNRRWYNNTEWVDMISGFYRSPEIMGWHAMMLVLVCIFLLLRRPQWSVLWVLLGVWGAYGVFLSGRRKMLLMLLVFLVVLPLVSGLKSRRRIFAILVPAILIAIPSVVWVVDESYLLAFSTGLDVAGSKVAEKGMQGPLWLIGIVGPFGYGVGTVTQGAQHFGEAIEVPQMEGGFEKIMVELGLLGALSAILFAFAVSWTAIKIVRHSIRFYPSDLVTPFCFAMVVANLSAFLIAFQFLGDPFIATFVGLLYGGLLATGSRQAQGIPSRRVVNSPRPAA